MRFKFHWALYAMSCAALSAQAADPPKLQPGLWEMSTTVAGSQRPPRSVKICIGSDTLSLLSRLDGAEAQPQNCSKSNLQIEGARVTTDASCKLDSSQVSTHTVTTYQGGTAFHSETQAQYDPPLFGRRDLQTTRDAKRLGECTPDMRPGDVTLANGIKMNILNAAGTVK